MTTLTFLGTKGEIEEESERHMFHSSLLLRGDQEKILVDYGLLHPKTLDELAPDSVFITHAHPDHYSWLKEDVDTEIPVFLTEETLEYGKYEPRNHHVIEPKQDIHLEEFRFKPYRVIHSIRCPAIGFKIRTPEEKVIVYNPDLVDIEDKDEILTNVDCYIGDGSCIKANLVRRKGDKLFGHTRITTQINWCRERDIADIIFTHVGKETLGKEEDFQAEHPEVTIAGDGMEWSLDSDN